LTGGGEPTDTTTKKMGLFKRKRVVKGGRKMRGGRRMKTGKSNLRPQDCQANEVCTGDEPKGETGKGDMQKDKAFQAGSWGGSFMGHGVAGGYKELEPL